MAYLDTTQDSKNRTSYVFGDKPYGNYWIEVKDSDVPAAPPVQLVSPPVTQDQLAAALAVISPATAVAAMSAVTAESIQQKG